MTVRSRRALPGVAAWAAALGVALTGACARQGAPPGGPDDRRPPVVIRTEPDTFALVEEGFRGAIRFHFDERISERAANGSLDDAVVVSPATGNVRVAHGRQSLTVELEGGYRPNTVYRVTLLPSVSDLFGNTLVDPFELVFTTGANFSPTAVAGLVWDRITGEGVEPAEVRAVATDREDSLIHVARTDTGGVYALRYLPPGRYELVAFQDRNRDGVVDPGETQGRRGVLLNSPTDTVPLHIAVLMPDTTPARVAGVDILDSVTLAVELDDYLDPAVALTNVGARLTPDSAGPETEPEEGADPPSSASPIEVEAIYHAHEYRAFVEAVSDSFARLDSLEAVARAAEAARAAEEAAAEGPPTADTTAAEVAPEVAAQPEAPEAPALARRVPPPELPGREARDAPSRPDGSEPPERILVLRLAGPLVPNQPYHLTVTGILNIAGVPQGGGEAAVVLTPPADTTAVASDSTAVDDTAAVRDSLAAPPDTGGVHPRLRTLLRRPGQP